jgi:hypothetical protein
MDESTNHYFITINNTIRGTYDNTNSYSYNYIEEIKNTIKYLIYNKTILEENVTKLEYNNSIALRDIKLLDKIYYCTNITHNNTINFILKNNIQIKFLLDKVVSAYNRNSYDIELVKEKIYDISQLIYIYESKLI